MKYLLSTLFFLSATSIALAEKPIEDFSTWANGSADSNNNHTLDILDDGSSTNGWSGNAGYSIQDSPEGKTLAVGAARGRPLGWNQMGKAHEIKLIGEKAVELTMRVANHRERGASFISAWLSNETRNGYGMSFGGIFPIKNRVGVRIFKLRDNEIAFDARALPKFSTEAGEPVGEKLTVLPELLPTGQFIDFHLRIEQAAPNAPVSLTLWNTGCPDVGDTSYEEPLLKLEDDGNGSAFHAADGGFGPVFNLETLTHLGFSSAQFFNKDLTPGEQAAEPNISFKQIDLRPVRP